MQKWRQITRDARDLLTICLAKSFDQALVEQCGSDWFVEFVESENNEKVTTRITKPGQQSVQDLDLQALLKILRHRNNLAQKILSYYGFFEELDSYEAEGQSRQLNNLLDRLVNDFRNRIEAHPRAADLEKELSGQGPDRIYGYEEAYQDILKLSRIFGAVTDSCGVSYTSQIAALAAEPPKKKWPLFAGIAAAIVAVVGLLFLLLPLGNSNVYQNEHAPQVKLGEIAIQPTHVYYEGEELIAICYVINGTDQPVSDVDVCSLRLIENGREFAAANFGILEGITLEPGESVQWCFRFPKEAILTWEARLPDLKWQAECRHS